MGSKETKNRLSDDGYQNISIFSNLETPSVELLSKLSKISPSIGEVQADFIDSIIGLIFVNF